MKNHDDLFSLPPFQDLKKQKVSFSDGFAPHDYDIEISDKAAESDPYYIQRMESAFLSLNFKEIFSEATEHAKNAGLDINRFVSLGLIERARFLTSANKLASNFERQTEEWYLSMIFLKICYIQLTKALEADDASDEFCSVDNAVRLGMQLGALCRELSLRRINKDWSIRGQLEKQKRSLGGKRRAHPQRREILDAMKRRIDSGQSIRRSARATFEVDRLGSSPNANESLWKRTRPTKQDRS